MASLSLTNVCKVYPNGFEAVKDFNLEVEDQEFIIFVGPSGQRYRNGIPELRIISTYDRI